MIHQTDDAHWRELERNADLPDVQELFRQEIQRGTIRVRPMRSGGIRIVPVGIPETEERIEAELPPAPSQEESSLTGRAVRRGRPARR